jgi:hypothetical protein
LVAADAGHTGGQACPERNHQPGKHPYSNHPRPPAPDGVLMLRALTVWQEKGKVMKDFIKVAPLFPSFRDNDK